MRVWRAVVGTLAAVAATAMLASTAGAASAATITPSLMLTPSSGVAASTQNLGTDIKFSYSTSGDTVKDLTLALPPGLIANASIDGGACLQSATPIAACQVGSGTITATATVLNLLGIKVPVTETLPAEFDLVAPPHAGDLAGLQVLASNPTDPGPGYQPLGTPADVTVRSSDAGLDISFTGLPNTYPLNVYGLGLGTVPISVSEINSTFDGLRFPSTCPSTPANVTVSADSYSAPSTSASAGLTVTGCSSAPYNPQFSLSAVQDAGDRQAQLTTTITQAANELTSRSTELAFPSSVLAPNLGVASALCPQAGPGCTAIGSVTAVSPLYPTPLTGTAYLTGASIASPSITLVFPPPFSLTLSGAVDLAANSTDFTGLPDIPLTKLQVTLNGGANGAFSTTCQGASGTATATLVSQNGDRTVNDSAPFTVSGWQPCSSGGGGTGGGGGGTGGGGGGSGGSGSHPGGGKAGRPRLSGGSISGLLGSRPTVRFTVTQGRNAGKLSKLTVGLSQGLTFARQRVHGHLRIKGVALRTGQIKSLKLTHGRLVITLRSPVAKAAVRLTAAALRESAHLHRAAERHKLRHVRVNVTVKDSAGRISSLHMQIHKLGLRRARS